MAEMPGIARPERQALPQLRDRMTFLYLEHCSMARWVTRVPGPSSRTEMPAAGT